MADGASDKQELAERQLVERVEAQVRNRLFATYAIMGGLVLSALGFFGYDVISGIRSTANDTASTVAEEAAAAATAPIIATTKERLAEVEKTARAADTTIALVRAQLQQISDALDRGAEQIALAGQQATNLKAQSAATAAEIQEKFGEAKSDVADLIKAIDAQKQRASGQFADAGTVADLAKLVERVAEQVGGLAIQIDEVATHSNVSITAAPTVGTELIESVKSTADAVGAAAGTVFFQFAILPREQAEAIADGLRRRGYTLPGEEREDAAKTLREVRFYFAEDEAAAKTLATAAGEVVTDLGYDPVTVTVNDLTGFRGQKPRPGILELWLGLPPK